VTGAGRSASGGVAEESINIRLAGGPEAAPRARRALARLRGDIDQPVMENLRLLVTELVANSIRHADAENVALKVLVTQPAVWTQVSDEGPGFEPAERTGGQDEESGWGLFLVDRLADRWGVVRDAGRTRVWFELRRS
jgi:anti-sigma regulatory factor (Ser/Thr protein kinase)